MGLLVTLGHKAIRQTSTYPPERIRLSVSGIPTEQIRIAGTHAYNNIQALNDAR